MTKALPFTQAGLARAIRAARAAGMRVTGIQPDGTLLLGGDDRILAMPAAGAQNTQAPPASDRDSDAWGDVEV